MRTCRNLVQSFQLTLSTGRVLPLELRGTRRQYGSPLLLGHSGLPQPECSADGHLVLRLRFFVVESPGATHEETSRGDVHQHDSGPPGSRTTFSHLPSSLSLQSGSGCGTVPGSRARRTSISSGSAIVMLAVDPAAFIISFSFSRNCPRTVPGQPQEDRLQHRVRGIGRDAERIVRRRPPS